VRDSEFFDPVQGLSTKQQQQQQVTNLSRSARVYPVFCIAMLDSEGTRLAGLGPVGPTKNVGEGGRLAGIGKPPFDSVVMDSGLITTVSEGVFVVVIVEGGCVGGAEGVSVLSSFDSFSSTSSSSLGLRFNCSDFFLVVGVAFFL